VAALPKFLVVVCGFAILPSSRKIDPPKRAVVLFYFALPPWPGFASVVRVSDLDSDLLARPPLIWILTLLAALARIVSHRSISTLVNAPIYFSVPL
jgi:hypothetical protein